MATGYWRTARTEKLKNEIDELTGVQEGQPEPSVKLDEEPTQSPEAANEGSPKEVTDGTAGQTGEDLTKDSEKNEVKDLEYWKKRALEAEGRFNTAKPKYDSNIKKLKDENIQLQQSRVELLKKVNDLNQKLASVRKNPIDEAFNKETVDVLGENTSEAIKKMLKQQQETIDNLTKQVEDNKVSKEAEAVDNARKSEYNGFLSELTELVPDQAQMNADEGFIEWLHKPNARGKIRFDLLRAAEQVRDAERVAEFFIAYKNEKKAGKPKDTIAARTGPSSQRSAGDIGEGKGSERIFTTAEVDSFYSDIQKGVYKGRYDERVKMEKAIEQAYLDGRIR